VVWTGVQEGEPARGDHRLTEILQQLQMKLGRFRTFSPNCTSPRSTPVERRSIPWGRVHPPGGPVRMRNRRTAEGHQMSRGAPQAGPQVARLVGWQ